MIYTCPKCGKKMDLSTEVLINSEYKVICPQCLSELQIVGDYAYIPDDSLNLDTTIEQSRTINCPHCGREVNSNAHFCPNCGTSFDEASSPVIDVEAVPVPPPIPNGDPLYNEAINFLASCTAITPMMLRDRFHISDERAAELIRQLEAGGIIGPYNNGGPRQILIPHRTLYGPAPRFESKIPEGGNPMPQRRGPGCVTIFIVVMFFFILMKACGM